MDYVEAEICEVGEELMGNEESVMVAEFEGRKELCNERFSRDKTRIDAIEERLLQLSTIVTNMAQVQTQSMKDSDDQEKRIRALEGRGVKWFDKIVDVALGALVMYVLSKSFGF